jgi:hypothetical protein
MRTSLSIANYYNDASEKMEGKVSTRAAPQHSTTPTLFPQDFDSRAVQLERSKGNPFVENRIEPKTSALSIVSDIARQTLASFMPPRVVPVRYGRENPAKVWAGVFLTNDGEEAAYDVRINETLHPRCLFDGIRLSSATIDRTP